MKKNKIKLTLLLILIFSFGFSQVNIKIIQLSDFYKGKGVIFPKDYKPIIILHDYKSSFTPTIKQIKKAETLFVKNIMKLC